MPTIDATARPISEEGTGVDGRNCVSAAQMSAKAAASGVDIAPNCDMSSARPKAFRNPASTSLDTKSTALAKPTAPAANSMRAASNTTNGTSCSPWTAVKAPRGTTTTAAEPATTPGRIPAMEAKPRDTQDQRPTKGPVPTMALQARALDSKEKATLTPARTSSTGLNSSTASSVSTSGSARAGSAESLKGRPRSSRFPPGGATKFVWLHSAREPRSSRMPRPRQRSMVHYASFED
mmetsp:Transcript_58543/g.95282  ORF Transcript_58543/g.95282 Transcript_58543/m.95282 type:complete len:236 (-) Transcript_58543:3-710(-)